VVTLSPVFLCAFRVSNKLMDIISAFLMATSIKLTLGISSVWIGSALSNNSSDGFGNNESVLER